MLLFDLLPFTKVSLRDTLINFISLSFESLVTFYLFFLSPTFHLLTIFIPIFDKIMFVSIFPQREMFQLSTPVLLLFELFRSLNWTNSYIFLIMVILVCHTVVTIRCNVHNAVGIKICKTITQVGKDRR